MWYKLTRPKGGMTVEENSDIKKKLNIIKKYLKPSLRNIRERGVKKLEGLDQ